MINIKNIFCVILLMFLITGCIPKKELIYLQDNNNFKQENLSLNTLNGYQLQPYDILMISIKTIDPKFNSLFTVQENNQIQNQLNEQSIYFTGYTIDNHGKIRMPVLGDLLVLGQTLEEVRNTIELKLLKDFFTKESGLFVQVKLSGIRITLNGEVTQPGTKIIYFDRVNVLEAIANAGDITMLGDRKSVMIIRQTPMGAQTQFLDLTDKNVINNPFYQLQPNDYIYVKPLKQKSWGTGTTGLQSFTTIVSVLSLVTTIFLLFKN